MNSNTDENITSPSEDSFYIVSIHDSAGEIEHEIVVEVLKKRAKKLGISIKIEVEESGMIKNEATAEEIERANAVLIVTDKAIAVSKYVGKPVLIKRTIETRKHPEAVLKQLIDKKVPLLDTESIHFTNRNDSFLYNALAKASLIVLPLALATGLFVFCSYIFGLDSFQATSDNFVPFSYLLMNIGGVVSFQLLLPVTTAAISYQLAGKQAIIPGIISGFLVMQETTGLLGSVLAALVTAAIVILVRKGSSPLSDKWEGFNQLFIIPILAVFLSASFTTYFVNDILLALSEWYKTFLAAQSTTNLFVRFLYGATIGVDLLGAFNEGVLNIITTLDMKKVYSTIASITAAGMSIPLGVALATLIFRKYYSYVEKRFGLFCFIFSAAGIPEGVIPIAIRSPISFLVAAVFSGGIAACLTYTFGAQITTSIGGLFAINSVQGNAALYLLAVVIGAICFACLFTFMRKVTKMK